MSQDKKSPKSLQKSPAVRRLLHITVVLGVGCILGSGPLVYRFIRFFCVYFWLCRRGFALSFDFEIF